jgi:NAD+ synthase
MKTSSTQFNRIREKIILNSVDYLEQYPGIQNLILGVSGGADSALIALAAKDVCDEMKLLHNRDINLIGRSLTMPGNKSEEISRAAAIGKLTCDDFKTMDLTPAFDHLINNIELPTDSVLEATKADKIRLGNVKARIRMIQLYQLAHYYRGIVLSTDNLSEYMLGFWTIHGDVGDFGMIQNLWKTEVYGVLKAYYNFSSTGSERRMIIRSVIEATPTDGLGITDSDLDQFGDVKDYEELDLILEEYSKHGAVSFVKDGGPIPKCLTIYENTHYKRSNPFNIPRHELMAR